MLKLFVGTLIALTMMFGPLAAVGDNRKPLLDDSVVFYRSPTLSRSIVSHVRSPGRNARA